MIKRIVIILLILIGGRAAFGSLQFPTPPFVRSTATGTPPGFTVIQSVLSTVDTWSTSITPGATGHLLAGTSLFGQTCAPGTTTVSDTAGNTWFIDQTLNDQANTGFTFVTFHAISNGTSATTVTLTHGTCTFGSIAVAEVSGVTLFDVGAQFANGAVGSTPTVTLATSHSNEFCTLQGNLASQPGGYTATWSAMQSMNTGIGSGTLGNDLFIQGPSTGTSTTMSSTSGYNFAILIGACYK